MKSPKPLSYEARTTIPDAAAIDRIVKNVIDSALYHQSQCRPGDAFPPDMTAKFMAREIKRQICRDICVEVDLVISGSTNEAETPSPAALFNSLEEARASGKPGVIMPVLFPGECARYLIGNHISNQVGQCCGPEELDATDLTVAPDAPNERHYSTEWWKSGIQLTAPLVVFRGSLPGPI